MGAGRPRSFETPQDLWDAFVKYAEEVKANPRLKTVFVGKDGEQKLEPLQRPLTMEGFQLFLWDLDVRSGADEYFTNKDGKYDQFSEVCSRIKKSIRKDQIEGGMVGQYNPSITQRLNGLVEKQETSITIEQPLFGDGL
jgi:hypothetical protein